MLKAAAPPATRRRGPESGSPAGSRCAPPSSRKSPFISLQWAENPYDLRSINRLLHALGRPPLCETLRPKAGPTATARWVLTTLMRRQDLRFRHPRVARRRRRSILLGTLRDSRGTIRRSGSLCAVFARKLEHARVNDMTFTPTCARLIRWLLLQREGRVSLSISSKRRRNSFP